MTSLSVDSQISARSPSIERALFDGEDLPANFEQVLLKHSILTREQKRELIKQHHEAQNKLEAIEREEIAKNGAIPLSRKNEIRGLEAQVHERETLALKHSWRLIFHVAKEFFPRLKRDIYKNLSKIKILFEGARGLLYALRNFKLEFDDSFTTYSVPCIKGYIRNAFKAERKLALNVRNLNDKNLYTQVTRKFWQKNNKDIGDLTQLAKDLNVDLAHLKTFVQQLNLGKFHSLSSTVRDSDTKVSDLFAAINSEDPELEIAEIKDALKALSPKQRVVLALKYGIKYLTSIEDIESLKEKHPKLESANFAVIHNSTEISRIFGYTPYGIRKIEDTALDKLSDELDSYRTKLHWIPEAINIQGLKQLIWHLFDHKQSFTHDLDEFSSLLLHRLATEKFNYRYKAISVLKPNEEKILRLRLGLSDLCKGGLAEVAVYLAGDKYSPDKLVGEIRRTEAEAIRKIYAFFNSKSPAKLREFFYPNHEAKAAKEPYSRKQIVEAFERYLEPST